MSRGEMPASELKKFYQRPKICGYCSAPDHDGNPLVIHHCYFRSNPKDEVTEKEWNWDWACVKHHTEGKEAAHHNVQVADHFRMRADMRRDGTIKTNPLI